MKNFLEKTLRQNVMIEETEYLNEKLPLAFRGRYTFYKVETNGSPWIAIQPKADVGLAALRKDWIKIEKAAGLNCAIFFDSTSFYIKEKLLEEGIPFVLKDKQDVNQKKCHCLFNFLSSFFKRCQANICLGLNCYPW